MSTNFETSIAGPGRSSRCPVQWEDPSLVGKYSPWQAFESAYSTPMLEVSLMDLGLDTKIYGLSDLPEMDVIHKLQPQDIAAQDYNPTPTPFKFEAEIPSLDMAISPEPSSHSLSPEPVSPGCFPAKPVKGFRTERRRAQNRKAQREFRARKDKSLQRLQIEVDSLKFANQNLSMENEARVHENLELKADLELRLLGHPSSNSLLELGVLA